MLLSHFLANQIAGKPAHISRHIVMCWYELTVRFCESSTFMAQQLGNWGAISLLPGS